MSDPLLNTVIELLKLSPASLSHQLTDKKVLTRAENVATNEDGEITFEMERHHPIGGSQYRAGLPMSALVTQRYRYTLNPATLQLDRAPLGEPVLDESQWDWGLLAEDNMVDSSFAFEEVEPGRFTLEESCVGFSAEVQSAEEGIELFTKQIDSWDFSLVFEGDAIRPDTAEFLCRRLQNECKKLAREQILDAWEERITLES